MHTYKMIEDAQKQANIKNKSIVFTKVVNGIEIIETYYPDGSINVTTQDLGLGDENE